MTITATRVDAQRTLGGMPAAAIGLGCMPLSGVYGAADDAASEDLIRHAIDLGVTHLDSADMYGWGHNETLVGRAIRGRRDRVLIATKFGQTRPPQPGASNGVNGRPDYVMQACEASLARLGVDAIDLYYQHRVDPQTPIEDTVGAMAELVTQGKVRHLGLSEAAAATVRKAHAVHPIAALQTEYSLWSRDPEGEILDTCRQLGVAFVAYSPLGRGFLTGRFRSIDDLAADDWRRNNPRFQGENFQKNLDLVAKVEELAEEKGCTPAQLALAWLLSRGDDVIPIPGSTRIERVAENAAAARITLSPSDVRALDALAPTVAGQRYAEGGMRAVNR
jgi:aryl-alcohol dehydrogenase-like predicted oxidoreductase